MFSEQLPCEFWNLMAYYLIQKSRKSLQQFRRKTGHYKLREWSYRTLSDQRSRVQNQIWLSSLSLQIHLLDLVTSQNFTVLSQQALKINLTHFRSTSQRVVTLQTSLCQSESKAVKCELVQETSPYWLGWVM